MPLIRRGGRLLQLKTLGISLPKLDLLLLVRSNHRWRITRVLLLHRHRGGMMHHHIISDALKGHSLESLFLLSSLQDPFDAGVLLHYFLSCSKALLWAVD
mmetsp:Transcript_29494/g.44812  ORF Transcript_29494/g.44812 Transcript_29494/m.44812 type:complete len:100 (-) Transcript_29494:4775-5074(-)